VGVLSNLEISKLLVNRTARWVEVERNEIEIRL
jgi:hypothetical protein